MKQAMRDRDVDKLSVLRFLLSEIKNVEIDAKHELSDDEIIALLRKETKRRKEAIEQYKSGGREDIAAKEAIELQLIDTFLPAQMSREAIEKIVSDTVIANPGQDFGQIMRLCMAATKGQADGKLVSELVRSKIS
jgi:uncharacterized protein